jgi:hypothetical protein
MDFRGTAGQIRYVALKPSHFLVSGFSEKTKSSSNLAFLFPLSPALDEFYLICRTIN